MMKFNRSFRRIDVNARFIREIRRQFQIGREAYCLSLLSTKRRRGSMILPKFEIRFAPNGFPFFLID